MVTVIWALVILFKNTQKLYHINKPLYASKHKAVGAYYARYWSSPVKLIKQTLDSAQCIQYNTFKVY